MSEPAAERVAAIRERHERELRGGPADDWMLRQCQWDRDQLLARLDEQAERVRALEEALRPFAEASRQIPPDTFEVLTMMVRHAAGARALVFEPHVFAAAHRALSLDSEP